MGDKDISIMSIHVETKNGIVYLTGSADNVKEINNAVALAKSVKGVNKVISTVTVVKD
jgi:hyperosmotically inducible protein